MRRIGFSLFLCLLLLSAVASAPAPAKAGGLEDLARERIAQETGLDEELIAILFISKENAQFILTFIYIDERVFNSKLKPDLLEALAPYRDEEAMLTLVTPARESYFNPLLISFTQDQVNYRVSFGAIRKISESFTIGSLPQGEVSAGVILLDRLEPELGFPPLLGLRLDVRKPFSINYMDYSTDFALGPSPGEPLGLGPWSPGGEITDLFQLILYAILNLLLFLLLGFLV